MNTWNTLSLKYRNIIFAFIFIVFFIELLRTAWLSDDCLITLRTVLNFIHGYGPTYNIDERVQAYTHPLWFLLISGVSALYGNVFTVTFVLSMSISLLTLWLFLNKITTNTWQAVIAASIFLFSKAFVDFSTSGLENPLSHLLIVSLILLALRATEKRDQVALSGYFINCAFLFLNRPDLSLLIAPLSLWVIVKNTHTPRILIQSLFFGILPVVIWSIFSLYYYGFLFSNTAYAKLGTGMPLFEIIHQGCFYLIDSLNRDPLTLTMILLGIVSGVYSSVFGRCLSLGIVLYLIYIITIGGDFMTGRFLTAPLLVAVIQIARVKWNVMQLFFIVFCIGIMGITNIQATLFSSLTYNNKAWINGIADERAYYFQNFGLLSKNYSAFLTPDWAISQQGVLSIPCGGLGYQGILWGPGVHLVDECALVDPFLSHLPAKYKPVWRIGHCRRQVPSQYLKGILLNKNLITDPKLHAHYDIIRKVTRGDLNDMDRWREIIRLNFGSSQKWY